MGSNNEDRYTEYRLVSAGRGSGGGFNVLRVMHSKNDLALLRPPLQMGRKPPDWALAPPPPPPQHQQPQNPNAEKFDPSKLAPGGGGASRANKANYFKKKLRPMFFGVGEDGEESLYTVRKKDPDRFPYLIKDSLGEILEGNVDGGQRANYVLFVVSDGDSKTGQKNDGFTVRPVSKWYKFSSKPKYDVLSTDEAEAQMKAASRRRAAEDRWLMRDKKGADAQEFSSQEEKEAYIRFMKQSTFRATADTKASNKEVEDEMDYDEVMSDDENPDFGIENEEDAKEAKKREFGAKGKKANFDDDDEEEDPFPAKKETTAEKKMKKVLRKRAQDDNVYVSDDDKNPYNSDDEESEEESEAPPNAANQPDPTKLDPHSKTVNLSPSLAKSPNPAKSPNLNGTPSLAGGEKSKKRESTSSAQPPLKKVKKEKPASPGDLKRSSSSMPTQAVPTPDVGYGGSSTSPRLQSSVEGSKAPSPKPQSPDLVRVKSEVSQTPALTGSGTPSMASGTGAMTIKLRVGGATSPTLSVSESGSPELAQEKKRKAGDDATPVAASTGEPKKIKLKLGGAKSPELVGPSQPAMTAQEILAMKNEEERKRRAALRKAKSPPLTSTSPTLSLTPQVSSGTPNPADVLTDDDVLSVLRAPNPPNTVKALVAMLKDKIVLGDNKTRIKGILRRLCTMENEVLKLK